MESIIEYPGGVKPQADEKVDAQGKAETPDS
jgi:hypothetical protein